MMKISGANIYVEGELEPKNHASTNKENFLDIQNKNVIFNFLTLY